KKESSARLSNPRETTSIDMWCVLSTARPIRYSALNCSCFDVARLVMYHNPSDLSIQRGISKPGDARVAAMYSTGASFRTSEIGGARQNTIQQRRIAGRPLKLCPA